MLPVTVLKTRTKRIQQGRPVRLQPLTPPPSPKAATKLGSSWGEGGKKKVYLAHDTTLDREVAFALIKAEGLDDTSRSRIQREAQAMGRLGSHPHIVTVFDLGQEQDQPYMVTELMGGGDVEGLIDAAPDHRLALEQAINIAVETCRGLEFAHSRGIVHRDLKPGNVWLTEPSASSGQGYGTAKIGDFGLAVSLDRSRLTTEGMMIGTVAYMPPEQAMGGEVTPRSDLYSLGAMLYEMVTGRPPFLGDDSVALIGQHINTPPVAPAWHNSGCPRALDALILRLLAKDASERPESASDVLSALNAIDLSEGPPLERGDGGISDPNALDSLAGGVFVGRQREMGDLKACLEDALSGNGRLVTLVGEPGIGKTRTAQELATYAGLRGAQVLWGRCYEEQGVPPYWPWVQAIRSYVRERDPEQLRSEMGAGAADIAEVVSDVRERLPDLQPAPQLEPEQARFRLFDSIAAFLKTASQRQPLVLVLDGARLLLVGTYRDVELSRQHPLAETLGELTRERLFQRVLLRGLTQEDVGHFIEMTSGNSAPRGLVEAVHSQTEGNPLFVTEVVRLLVQEGHISAHGEPFGSAQDRLVEPSGPSTGSGRTGETDSWTIRIPEGVREVIGRRLNRLSQRCNEVLTVASVIGREFMAAQLKPLVEEVTEDRLYEILEEALAARVIEELPQSVGRYQFTHALIQETLAEELSTTRKVRLHARVAQALEQLYGDDADAHAAELAHHFSEAEAMVGSEQLVRYSLLAGERALASYAWEEAQGQFERGLTAKGVPLTGEELPTDGETAALLFGLGRAQGASLPWYEVGTAVASLRRAFDYYASVSDIERAVAAATYPIFIAPGGHTGAAQRISAALELTPLGSPAAGNLLSQYGLILGLEEGDYEGAQTAFRDALEIAHRENNVDMEMSALVNAVQVDYFHIRRQECLDKCRRVVELARRTENEGAEVRALFHLSQTLVHIGDLGGARTEAKSGLEMAERLRNIPWLSQALWAEEIASRVRGDFQAARQASDRGLELSPFDVRLLSTRSVLEYELGDLERGGTYLDRLLEVMRSFVPGPTPACSLGPLAIALAARITGIANAIEIAHAPANAAVSTPTAIPIVSVPARASLALLAVLRNDGPAAEEQYSALEPYRGAMVPLATVSVDRVLALLSHTMGQPEKAVGHFEDALTFCRKAGYRPELAWGCCDYADTLLQLNNEGNRAKAMALLDESLAISSELGMRPLIERVLSRREILGA